MKFRNGYSKQHCPGNHAPLTCQQICDGLNARALFNGAGGLWREYELQLQAVRELGPCPCHACAFDWIVRRARAVALRDGLPWLTLADTLSRRLAVEKTS